MCTLHDVRDQIKASLKNSQGCVTDKVVSLLADLGVDNLGIADALGITIRAVQKSRKRSPVANASEPEFANQSSPAHGEANCSSPKANQSSYDAHGAANQSSPTNPPSVVIPARATFESLRDESIPEVKQDPPVGPPKPIAEPKALRSRGSRLSNDWQLPDDWKAWTRTNFPTTTETTVTEEADKFRDYWCAKAGQGASKLDWQAVWRNWCRTAFAPGKRRDGQPINHGRGAYDEQRAGTEHWLEEKRRRMDETARLFKIGKYRETPVESVQ